MSFITKLFQEITKKQVKTFRQMEQYTENLTEYHSKNYFERLRETFTQHLQNQIYKHSNNIDQYLLLGDGSRNILGNQTNIIKNISMTIHKKQQDYNELLGQQLDEDDPFLLDIDTYRTTERIVRKQPDPFSISEQPLLIQYEVVEPKVMKPRVVEPLVNQQKLIQNSYDSPKKVNYPDTTPLNEQKVVQNHELHQKSQPAQIEIVRDERVSSYKLDQQKKLNRQNTNLTASEMVGKRDIVQQLEERRKKLFEKHHKSKKLQLKLIKLQPIARKEDKEARQRQAKEKINEAIEFVKSIQNKKKSNNFKITEWKQDRSIKTVDKEGETPPQKYSQKKVGLYNNRFQGRSFQEGSQIMGLSGKRLLERSLVKGDKSYILSKPLPYNLYNVSTKDQLFQLQYK